MSDTPGRATAPSREALLAVHSFPGEFIIKAFGKGGPDFEAAAVQVATEALGADRVGVQVRTTPSGTRQCVTLTLQARTVEDVETVYARLFALPDLLLIL
jgi:putative lipoic acid-binding regulatory protein